ncbi:MAG: SDR family NAD(P)-dependent oxidoreductase, partial [Anaerolineae bacterium]|nr:SDR family NAD(P)-dependent oxidoreductase [Anaerolineae bacterium]
LEMARAAGELALRGKAVTQIKDVVWLRPLVVGDAPVETQVGLYAEESGKVRYEVSTLDEEGHPLLHSQGQLVIGTAEESQTIDLAEIRQRCPERMTGETCYRRFEAQGLIYGPTFQVIEDVVGNDSELLARLRLPAEVDTTGYTLPPSLLDGVLQSVSGLTGVDSQNLGLSLPFALDRLELLAPFPTRGYAYAYVTRLAEQVETAHFNIALLDDQGRVCLKLHNFTVKAIPQPEEPGWCYHLYWQQQALAAAQSKTAQATGDIVLVFPKGLEPLADRLMAHYPQQRVVRFVLSDKNMRLSETEWEVDLTDSEGITASLDTLTRIDTLYFLGGLSGQHHDPFSLDGLARSQEQGVLNLFRLVKVLEQRGLMGQVSRLKVLTQQAQQLHSQEPIQPWSASLSGLTMSLAREYPAVEASCIDVILTPNEAGQPILAEADVLALIAEGGQQGQPIALRQGVRYIRRLAPLTMMGRAKGLGNEVKFGSHPPASAPCLSLPYRPSGVYLILGGAGGIGLETAIYLAERVQAKVVLVGRSALTGEKQAQLERIRDAGGDYLYCRADGANLSQMQAVVREANETFGPINGVIHSALVLRDGSLRTTTEVDFRAVLAPKVTGSVVLAEVVKDEPLDFMLFFSSVQSMWGNAGQGNYAAGSTFADAYALYLNQVRPYPVKVINWGYWGSVGVVATDAYRQRLAEQGIQSIEVEEGMAALDQILVEPLPQVVAMKVEPSLLEQRGGKSERRVAVVPAEYASVFEGTVEQLTEQNSHLAPNVSELQQEQTGLQALEDVAQTKLLQAFQKIGVFQAGGEIHSRQTLAQQLNILPKYQRFYTACLDILHQASYLDLTDTAIKTTAKVSIVDEPALAQQQEALIQNYPLLMPHLTLLNTCLKVLPEIVQGHIPATEVLFPNSSPALVEGIYRGSLLTDYFNHLTAIAVRSYLEQRWPSLKPGQKVRIVEVGAGTGGTTGFILAALEPYTDRIAYVYTDISQGFVRHGQNQFADNHSFMEFGRLDIEQPPDTQGFALNKAEVVLGANVLHATRDIEHTLHNLKALLKANGLLLLNEATRFSAFATLTFGLLDGWWAFEDTQQRIDHTPLLSVAQWQQALHIAGFKQVHRAGQSSGQALILAESDGICAHSMSERQPVRSVSAQTRNKWGMRLLRPETTGRRLLSNEPNRPVPVAMERTPNFERGNADKSAPAIEQIIIQQVARATGLAPDRVDPDKSFAEYGVDSIVGIELINGISQALGQQLRTTALFDYPTVHRLAQYIQIEYEPTLASPKETDKPQTPSVEPRTTSVEQLFGPQEPLPNSNPIALPLVTENDTAGGIGVTAAQAVVIEKPGGLETLRTQAVRIAPPGRNEVQIAVRAFSLNFGDLLCLKGLYPTMPPYPFVPGFEVAGVIHQVGQDVRGLTPGDEVIALTSESLGGHSTLVTTRTELVLKKPANLDFETACAVPVTFLTAYDAFEKAAPMAGEKVLIQTAAGGVGLMAVQLAQQRGAEIFATAGSAEKCAYLKQLGIDHVINYHQEDFSAAIQRLTQGYGVDVVLNTLSGDNIQKGLDSLAPGGRYVEIAMTGLKAAHSIDLSSLGHNQSLHFIDLRRLLKAHPEQVGHYLQTLSQMLRAGEMSVTVDQVFPFSQLRQAYQYLDEGRNIGKVVVSTADVASKPLSATPVAIGSPGQNDRQDIAIIGMAGRFPGAKDLAEFWKNLAQGHSAITEVPPQRWLVADHYDPDPEQPNKTYSKWGGFLDDIDCFDPQFFKLSGREAGLMDPQQRLFLETCWSALEDAGYSHRQLDNRSYGVFLGGGKGDYDLKMKEAGVAAQAHSFMGNDASISAARIAYLLNLKGPAVAIDTACSSSLVAIHLACQSLQQAESEVALAGGVFITTTPQFHILSAKAGMLSPDGKCKTFDNRADGFVPGEGVGVVVLKPMAQAEADGDHIYGVIRGSGLNQDGKTNGITAPSTLSQTELEKGVYERSRINPESISYVEAHGTGTKLGDPIEIEALTNAFRQSTDKQRFCAIGSVKSNIGHLATAAGVAGVIKVLLALKHKQIPPSLHFEQPNEHIDFETSPFYVTTELKDWEVESGPRRAAVSSFGFSGTNAHLVIEEYQGLIINNEQLSINGEQLGGGAQGFKEGPQVIVLSARNEEQLRAYAGKLLTFLEGNSMPEPTDQVPNTSSIEPMVRAMVAEIVGVAPADIESKQSFESYGFDPVQLSRLKTMVEAQYQAELSRPLFTKQASVGTIVQHLAALAVEGEPGDRTVPQPSLSLASIAYTLQVGREAMEQRLALVVSSVEALIEKLKQYDQKQTPIEGVYRGNPKSSNLNSELLIGGEAGEGFIRTVIRNRELHRLAQLWVSGVEIVWPLLYPNQLPRRMSLPTYPFAKKRYWFERHHEKGHKAERVAAQPTNRIPQHYRSGKLVLQPPQTIDRSTVEDQPDNEPPVPEVFPIESVIEDIAINEGLGKTASPAHETSNLSEFDIRRDVQHLLRSTLYLDEQIDEDKPFNELGLDSITGVEFVKAINQTYSVTLQTNELYDYPTIRELSTHIRSLVEDADIESQPGTPDNGIQSFVLKNGQPILVKNSEQGDRAGSSKLLLTHLKTVPAAAEKVSQLLASPDITTAEVAVIGIAGRYPMAESLAEFWQNLKAGRNCITEIPAERWHWRNYAEDLEPDASRWGGFIEDVDKFDPLFFNISPREAERMDPQERLFLETVWATVEDAGYSRSSLAKLREVGVFVGVMYHHYPFVANDPTVAAALGTSSYWQIANRVSYFFDWHGPSLAIDTACSSSLTAIHLACESIKRGECLMAVAGGVNLSLHPAKWLALSHTQMLSSETKSKSLGDGDGFLPGEGVGAVLLKRLDQAIADKDPIYAVIKGSSLNHGGRTAGFTVPNPQAQVDLIRRTFAKTGVKPHTLSYIEVAATGSALGDHIEIAGLSQVFQPTSTGQNQRYPIGSVKSNIGHLEAASGISQLTKVLLQLKYQTLVPSINVDPVNPNLQLERTPFYIQKETQPWLRPEIEQDSKRIELPRRAAISSFGAGGANAHLVVEEYEELGIRNDQLRINNKELGNREHGAEEAFHLIILSAKNEARLKVYVQKLLTFLEDEAEISLTELAYTLQIGREAMVERLALVVQDVAEIQSGLSAYLEERETSLTIPLFKGTSDISRQAADILSEDQTGQDMLEKLIDHRDWAKLALLWTKGVDLPWEQLYGPDRPRRISLPTYPFERRRYWLASGNGTAPAISLIGSMESMEEEIALDFDAATASQADIEAVVARIWKNVLGVEHVTPDYNFFELGGTSLLVTQVSTRINHHLQLDVSPQVLFEKPTLAELADYIYTVLWATKADWD